MNVRIREAGTRPHRAKYPFSGEAEDGYFYVAEKLESGGLFDSVLRFISAPAFPSLFDMQR
jgi:hypothetical protein